MSSTLPILTDIQAHLQAHITDWAIELTPDNPEEYFLAHPNGAVLIGFAGSRFNVRRASDIVVQGRELHIVLTILCRHLHHDHGALALLDTLRLLIVGFKPANCSECFLLEEQFDGVSQQIWQYQLALRTDTMQVQQTFDNTQPHFQRVITRQQSEPLNSELKPKQ